MHLLDVLWAYRTSLRNAKRFFLYYLVYGSEAIASIEMMAPTTRVSTVSDVEWDATTCIDW